MYNFSNELTVTRANLRNQCYRDYFYGKEKDFEIALGDIEHQASILFSLIDQNGCLPPPGTPEHITMILYMLVQHSRTKYSADALDDMHDKMMKHLFREKIESEVEGINLDDFIIGIQDASRGAIGYTLQTYLLLLDLRYKLFLNRTKVDFVTSDNPVVMINPFMSFRRLGSNTGVATKGLQIFFPIAPDRVILFYDHDVYRVGGDKKIVIDIENSQDVYNINVLQACSCYENIYFKEKNFGARALHRKAKPFMRTGKAGIMVFPQEDSRYRKSEIVMNFREDICFNPNLSFLGIRKSAKEWRLSFQKSRFQPAVVVRNQEMCDDHDEFIKLVDAGKYSSADFFRFLSDRNSES